jgi:hypothetical protein
MPRTTGAGGNAVQDGTRFDTVERPVERDLESRILSSLMALDRVELEELLPFLSAIAITGVERPHPEIFADLARRHAAGELERALSNPRAVARLAELLRSVEVVSPVPKARPRPAPMGSVKAGPLARIKLTEDT